MKVDKIPRQNLGARGEGGCKGRWVERREKGRIGESLGKWDGWDGRYGSKEGYNSTKAATLGFARDLILEGFPGPMRGPQIVPWAAEERVPELALSHCHTDEYLTYHHRTFIWQWMETETETETHIGALD